MLADKARTGLANWRHSQARVIQILRTGKIYKERISQMIKRGMSSAQNPRAQAIPVPSCRAGFAARSSTSTNSAWKYLNGVFTSRETECTMRTSGFACSADWRGYSVPSQAGASGPVVMTMVKGQRLSGLQNSAESASACRPNGQSMPGFSRRRPPARHGL